MYWIRNITSQLKLKENVNKNKPRYLPTLLENEQDLLHKCDYTKW